MMEPATFEVRFPLGKLPVRGFRCPICGEEALTGTQAKALDELARRLGLFGIEDKHRRKLLRTGNSIAVSLDPELVRDVLHGAKPGAEVFVGRQGDKIVITAE